MRPPSPSSVKLRQYLYFRTRKASKASKPDACGRLRLHLTLRAGLGEFVEQLALPPRPAPHAAPAPPLRQYLYFCTSKAPQLHLNWPSRLAPHLTLLPRLLCVSICTFVLVKHLNCTSTGPPASPRTSRCSRASSTPVFVLVY
jgi:hypothetical protein